MNQQQLLPSLTTQNFLDKKPTFNDQGSFRERLEFLIKWQPNGVHGLELEHLQSTPDDPGSNSVPKPVFVRIKRECLTDLVKILDKPKKSIQRGLATFFRSTFGLHNVSNYNREWLIFGTKTDQELKKKRKTQKKKTALKGARNLANNKIKSQLNEDNNQNENNKNVKAIGNRSKKIKESGKGSKNRSSGSGSDSGSARSINRKTKKKQAQNKTKQEKVKSKSQKEDENFEQKQKPQLKIKKKKKKKLISEQAKKSKQN